MKRTIALTLSTISLTAGALVLGAIPAQAAEGCDSGAVCYVLDGSIQAEVAPAVTPSVHFDQIINNSSSTIQISWVGWGESSMFEGYIEGKGGTDFIHAGSGFELGSTTATSITSLRIVR